MSPKQMNGKAARCKVGIMSGADTGGKKKGSTRSHHVHDHFLDLPICGNKEHDVRVPWITDQMIVNSKGFDVLQGVLVLRQLHLINT